MNPLRPHRAWLALMIFAILLMAGSGPLLHFAREKAAHNLDEVKAARLKTAEDLRQLRANVAAAHQLSGQIDRAGAEQVLAPVDRLKAVTMFEQEAGATQLSHFTYTLTPEERVSMGAGGEAQELAVSSVTLAADAPDDLTIYRFIERVRSVLPGRARVQQLTVARINAAAIPRAAANVHFDATLEWLSNGTLQTVAGGP